MELKLDLTKSATRKALLEQLLGMMSEDQRVAYDKQMAAVEVPDKHHHNIDEVNETINILAVSDSVKESMRGVYAILAAAEAKVHGCEVEHTHFHEVGNGSGIANALAICVAFDVLSPEKVLSTPVQTGEGTVLCAHGEMNIPAPATAAILSNGIPTVSPCLEGELCTPTSAALISFFVDEFVA